MSSDQLDLSPFEGGGLPLQPGPIPPGGAPDPTEIVCIEVEKVFDYCFQETTAQRVIPIPGVVIGAAARGVLNTEAAVCNVLNSTPGPDDLRNVNMTVTVPATVEIGELSLPVNFVVFKSLQLYAPDGATVHSGVTGTCLCELIDQDDDGRADEVACQANLCVVIQSKAMVKLLVPAYGIGVPGPVRDAPAALT